MDPASEAVKVGRQFRRDGAIGQLQVKSWQAKDEATRCWNAIIDVQRESRAAKAAEREASNG